MFLRIETLSEKIMVGKRVRTSLANNRTAEVWQDFMSNRSKIENALGTALYSIQVYDTVQYFKNFSPHTEFVKWAATAVVNIDDIPNGFEALRIESGTYAVFLHKGLASEFHKTMQYIFSEWLPGSQYELDDRPHFELLGEKYKNNNPDSEEEVWIPVK